MIELALIKTWQASHLYLLQELYSDKHWSELTNRILLQFPPSGKRQTAFLETLAPANAESAVKGDWSEFLSLLYRTLTSHKRHSKFTFEFFAAHPATPDFVIEALIEDRQALKVIAKHRNLKSKWLEVLLGLEVATVSWELLENQTLTTDQCASLYCSLKEEWELWHFARWANASEEIFQELNRSGVEGVRSSLAKNRHLNSALLLKLIKDDDEKIGYFAAMNPALDSSCLSSLSQENVPQIIVCGLARNPSASARVLQQIYERLETSGFTTDQIEGIEQAIVRNNNCSPGLLSEMCEKVCKRKRFSSQLAKGILENQGCPNRVLLDCYQRVIKWSHEYIFASGAGIDWALSSKKVLAANPNCPLEILRELASSHDAEVRAFVARNENVSSSLLDEFKGEKNRVVLESLADNKATSPELLSTIWGKKSNQTRNMAQRIYVNPNCSAETAASIDSQFKFSNKYEMFTMYSAEIGVKYTAGL